MLYYCSLLPVQAIVQFCSFVSHFNTTNYILFIYSVSSCIGYLHILPIRLQVPVLHSGVIFLFTNVCIFFKSLSTDSKNSQIFFVLKYL